MLDRRIPIVLAFVLAAGLLAGLVSCRSGGSRTPATAGPRPAPSPTIQHPHESLVGEEKAAAMRGPRLASVTREPVVRVRIQRGATGVTLAGSATLTVGPGQADSRRASARAFAGPVKVRHDGAGFIITDGRGASVRWALSTLHVTSVTNDILVDGDGFPGSAELVAQVYEGKYTGRLDVVNHVGMEQYLPGVLSQEMYPKWHEQAYMAQAVAARSYAIWEMNLPVRKNSHYDLEAGEASQAYIGSKAHDTAKRAVATTRGLVLSYDGRVLPAFYSSCSGGMGQDAVAAFPGRVVDLPPLRGRNQGQWGQASSKFSWGPVEYPKPRLAEGMRRWGTANKNPIAGLSGIRDIRVTGRNAVGRPTAFVVIDINGAQYPLGPEDLRQAGNTRVPGDSEEAAQRLKLWSSHVEITVLPSSILFNGRGFGHGVGMCQFGAQGMASANYPYTSILDFYYHGATITRAY